MIELNQIHQGDFRDRDNSLEYDIIITDPPYNLGYGYDVYDDNLTEEIYMACLRPFEGEPAVFIHYPEDMIRLVCGALGNPHKCVSWVYNANTPRQWRMIAWFNCSPDLSKVKQPYKNPKDRRIIKLMAEGSKGASLYDWWNVQQVKNVSEEKTEHPCQIPLEIMRNIILTTTKPNDIIFDPFAGSGTTAVAAIQTGRRFVGYELSEKYCEIARDRIYKARERYELLEELC